MEFWHWFVNILGIAYFNPNSWLSVLSWFAALLEFIIFAVSIWGFAKVRDASKTIAAKVLKFATPISIVVVFVCFAMAAYSAQTQQVTDLEAAKRRIGDLENSQALATKALEQPPSPIPTAPLLKAWVNGAMVIHKVPNRNYNPSYPSGPELIFDICCPNVPNELLNDDSVVAVNYKFYVMYPISIDSVQLSINGKYIASAPLFSTQATPEMETWNMLFWLYFKCEGVINPDRYDNVTLIVTADNATFISNPFEITIPEPEATTK